MNLFNLENQAALEIEIEIETIQINRIYQKYNIINNFYKKLVRLFFIFFIYINSKRGPLVQMV